MNLDELVAAASKGEARGPLLKELQLMAGNLGLDALPSLAELQGVRGFGTLAADLRKQILKKPVPKPDREAMAEERHRAPADGVPEGWEDPPGWELSQQGIFKVVEDDDGESKEARVTFDPMWINARWRDADSGDHHLELGWPSGSEVVDRGTAMQARELSGLAAKGAPVSSRSSRDLVAYLEAAESWNRQSLPVKTSITRLGWTRLGEEWAWQSAAGPHLLRADGGHAQVIASMEAKGTWEEWKAMANEICKLPVPALLLCASAASPSLEITGGFPLVVDLHGTTTSGKTTSARFAASLWANPDDAALFIMPWNSTPTAIERRAALLHHIPTFVDDSKKVQIKDRDKLASIVYGWGSGQGKARGTVGGVQATAAWKSILISTGEASLAMIAGEHAGLRMRILPVSDCPIPRGHKAVRQIEDMGSWGHGGIRIAEWMRANRKTIPKSWEKARVQAEADLKSDMGSRMANFIASIGIGAKALRAIGVEVPWKEVYDLLKKGALAAMASADIPGEAWNRIQSWVVANEGRIAERPGWTSTAICPQGWIGKVCHDGQVAISPPALEGELKRLGYDAQEMIPQWAAKGLITEKPEVVKWLGKSARMYRLNAGKGWTQISIADMDDVDKDSPVSAPEKKSGDPGFTPDNLY